LTVKRTTDEWTEDFFPQFAKDVDVHISMFSDLKGQEAYTLRRMIMISLRGGPSDLQKLTDKLERVTEELCDLTCGCPGKCQSVRC